MNFMRTTTGIRLYSTLSNVLQKEKWDLLSAICLERKPVNSTEKNEIEREFSRMQRFIELENSFKSDHELRMEKDRLQAELLKSKTLDIDIDQTLTQTAQDFEDASVEEYKKFQFQFKGTEADKTNDVHTHERKLDRHLLLLVQQNLGDQSVWMMPQGVHKDGETLLQTAARVLQEYCGDDLTVEFYGYAPCGVYRYKYPKNLTDNINKASIGAKVFFFKARYIEGKVKFQKLKHKEIKWLGRDELMASLPQKYYKTISQFLINED